MANLKSDTGFNINAEGEAQNNMTGRSSVILPDRGLTEEPSTQDQGQQGSAQYYHAIQQSAMNTNAPQPEISGPFNTRYATISPSATLASVDGESYYYDLHR